MGYETRDPSKKAQKIVNANASSNTTKQSQHNVVLKMINIHLFFDGTQNNKNNIDSYRKNSMVKQEVDKNKDDYKSYLNAYSNVAHLFAGLEENSSHLKVYIQGMGTTDGHKDDQRGFAFGAGAQGDADGWINSGIPQRAHNAFVNIANKLKKVNLDPNARINLNVFGFSRGAATARHFIHLLHSEPKLSENWKVQHKNISVNFVGLFDTVSSYDPVILLDDIVYQAMFIDNTLRNKGANFLNDVKELHLNFEKGYANKVFHLCASDEYRIYFSLTNIQSAIDLGIGYEVYLPGAHSDIGGGYNQNEVEEYDLLNEAKLEEWLIKQGFCTPTTDTTNRQIFSKTRTLSRGRDGSYEQETERYFKRIVKNNYHKVSLLTMKKMFELVVPIILKEKKWNEKYFQPYISDSNQIIQALLNTIPNYIIKNCNWGSRLKPDACNHLYGNLVTFRNQYVHWSSKDKVHLKDFKEELGFQVRRGSHWLTDDEALKAHYTGKAKQYNPYRHKISG